MKVNYNPKIDCCNHYKTDTYTVGYLSHYGKKPSRFKVYICDNCGEVHIPYGGIKGWLANRYFIKCNGCIFIPEE